MAHQIEQIETADSPNPDTSLPTPTDMDRIREAARLLTGDMEKKS